MAEIKFDKAEIARVLLDAKLAVAKEKHFDNHTRMLLPTIVSTTTTFTWILDTLWQSAGIEVSPVLNSQDMIQLTIRKADNSIYSQTMAAEIIDSLIARIAKVF